MAIFQRTDRHASGGVAKGGADWEAVLARMPFLHLALVAQAALTGGMLGLQALLDAAGLLPAESNMAEHLKWAGAWAYVSALLVAPLVETACLIAMTAIARKLVGRWASIGIAAAVFSAFHSLPSIPPYTVLFLAGAVFCAMNQVGLDRGMSRRARFTWLTSAHSAHNGLAVTLFWATGTG